MSERHSGYGQTYRGDRANSSGKPRRSGYVDIDGVPTKYTKTHEAKLPPEFWVDFNTDPAAAIAKWTKEE